MSVALIQGNIPQARKLDRSFRKFTLERYESLTWNAVKQYAPTLIIWPEDAVPGDVQHHQDVHEFMRQLAVDTQTYLLVGNSEQAKFTNPDLRTGYYNSLVLFTPEGAMAGEYRKVHLVPYGEYDPLKGLFKRPRALSTIRGGGIPGTEISRFKVDSVMFGSTICWENIFPHFFREFVLHGAQFMVNATNEAWFGKTTAPYQLLAMNVFRAVENRISVIRAANTGVSAFIDPYGRISAKLMGPSGEEVFVEGILAGNIILNSDLTFYTLYGDVFSYFLIGICVVFFLFSLSLSCFSAIQIRVFPPHGEN